MQVHTYITQTSTAAALSAKKEKGTDEQEKGNKRRKGVILFFLSFCWGGVWRDGVYLFKQPCVLLQAGGVSDR